jgi:hypothetical protein
LGVGTPLEIAAGTTEFVLEETTESHCEEDVSEADHLAQVAEAKRDHVGEKRESRARVEDDVFEGAG